MSEDYADITEMRQAVGDSACPSLFRIVPARDGGICRVKLPLGYLSSGAARAVAGAVTRFGNGGIEITNRANFQIRGIAPQSETPLIAALVEAGLGPTRPEADDIRNVMASPTAGIDPAQIMDTLPAARELLALLQTDERYTALSPKFCILVDGGEGVAIVDHPHDIWLASIDEQTMALGLAGCPPLGPEERAPFVAVARQDVRDAVAATIAAFLEAAQHDPSIRRLKHLLSRVSREELFERLPGSLVTHFADIRAWRRKPPVALGHVGIRNQRQHGFVYVGAVPPLGRVSAQTLEQLAAVADDACDGGLRLTPWQSVIVPSVRREDAANVVRTLEASGLTCDPDHPLASIVACSGSVGCASALSDTKVDALRLARSFGRSSPLPGTIHFSGCAKSCASAGVADFTFLASAPGTYALYRNAISNTDKFGRLVGGNLSVEQAGNRIREEMPAPCGAATKGGE